jgi:hypothetical protein
MSLPAFPELQLIHRLNNDATATLSQTDEYRLDAPAVQLVIKIRASMREVIHGTLAARSCLKSG